MDITLRLDDTQLKAWAAQLTSGHQIANAASAAINKAMREARREALQIAAIDLNVPIGIAKQGIAKPVRATEANLTSVWFISKSRISILSTKGARFVQAQGVTVKKGGRYYSKRTKRQKGGGGLFASTSALTGGGSAALNAPKAFALVGGRGGMAIMVRTGKGRKQIRAIYATMTRASMGQSNGAARKKFQEIGNRHFVVAATTAMQQAINGQAVDPTGGVVFGD